MRIKKKLNQHRRDFTAVYVCEHCGAEKTMSGYDDTYFHQTVIPQMKCRNCGETSPDDVPRTAPDVPSWMVL